MSSYFDINDDVALPASEVELQAIRAHGPGGQNVNKVASAIHLFFDIRASSLPDDYKQKLLACPDQRITRQGVLVIKAGRYRTQEQNREDALNRLREFIQAAMIERKSRKPTRTPGAVIRRRLEGKARIARLKKLRKGVEPEG